MFTTKDAALLMSSFSVYKGILHRTVPNAFYRLLCAYDAPPVEFARAWGEFFALLCDRGYSGNLSRCLSETALFDENASCHIALGLGFPNVIKDYDKYTLDEIHDKGVNDSVIHVDFMVGDATMNIDGITPDGEVIPVFRNGNWAEKFM